MVKVCWNGSTECLGRQSVNMHKSSSKVLAKTGITLVLGSGGARGLCFIGVLAALEEANIPIRRIIGASMGAIIGAAYASGKNPSELREIAKYARPGMIPTFSLSGPGVFTPRAVRKLIEKFIPQPGYFEDLSIPLSVICSDYRSGLPVEIYSGDLKTAVLGSSVAGAIFDPVNRGDQLLVDAGYSAPVPVQFAPPDGLIVAVSAMVDPAADQSGRMGYRLSNMVPGWLLSNQMIRMFDIQGFNLARVQMASGHHIAVMPELGTLKFTEFRKHKFAIDAGYQAMRTHMPEIVRELS